MLREDDSDQLCLPSVSWVTTYDNSVALSYVRHSTAEAMVQAEVTELRNELAEARLRVEQLTEQEAVLKATIRTLETELKTER